MQLLIFLSELEPENSNNFVLLLMFFTLTVMTDVQYTMHHTFSRLFHLLVKNATGMLQFTQEKQKDDNTATRTQFDVEKCLSIFSCSEL